MDGDGAGGRREHTMSGPSQDDPSRRRSPAGDSRAGVPAANDPWHTGSGGLFVGVGAICETAARLTGMDGAALAVLTPTSVRELVHATDAVSQQIDELQFTLGEGPCVDAYRLGGAVLCPAVLDNDFQSRWPAFATEVAEIGVEALFAFPVPGYERPMGVLELYRRTSGAIGDREERAAHLCAQSLQTALESNWREHLERSSTQEAAIDAVDLGGATPLASNPFTRTQVHIAAGMVAVQLNVTTAEALDRLRAHAYAAKRSIVAVAADVVARRLSFAGSNGEGHRTDPRDGRR
ncbi:hypothetical protein MPSYJ_46020 [Mycolicibacterium psychrotolerans]|uniref:ANTAR domain-containing protein n=1 Tax=Mycolicibacterium psychrotolerans TaxID=216929 RepID=A0A7I7MFN3_9MYCO|nr:hypothetical protein MPSYJ_46020 [Mycolicibacterium psychrotolerans]